MEEITSDLLQQADAYLEAGRPDAALPLLLRFVRQNPRSERGWLLLGQAVTDPQQQADCFIHILKINPGNLEAQKALNQLVAPEPDKLAFPEMSPPYAPVFTPEFMPVSQEEPASHILESRVPTLAEEQKADLTSAKTQQAAERKERMQPGRRRKKTPKKSLIAVTAILFILLMLVCLVGGYLSARSLQIDIDDLIISPETFLSLLVPQQVPLQASLAISGLLPTSSLYLLPATWTPTSSPTPTPLSTPSPAPTSTELATLPPPAPTTLAQMDRIAKEVSDLRGLPILTAVPGYLITRIQARDFLSSKILTDDIRQELQEEAIVLSTLGLISPDYDLENYTLNGYVDGIGGLYLPDEKLIYILGIGFRGMEHFVYSHEFDHALTDQNFAFSSSSFYSDCENDEQRCTAVRALVEGDATLLMALWAREYATKQDYRDILAFQTPVLALPEDDPPPYVLEDINFPYKYGVLFVKFLYDKGKWAAVDKAYQRLPESSEQILHPQKYLDSEPPISVQDPDLAIALGEKFRLLKDDVLGEWMTYLLLAYGADPRYQITQEDAQKAAQGWGGDHIQVYYSDETGENILSVHWLWDSQGESEEFQAAMQIYLDNRFQVARSDNSGGTCWIMDRQASCLFRKDNQVLWLLAPNQTTLDSIFAHYSDFH